MDSLFFFIILNFFLVRNYFFFANKFKIYDLNNSTKISLLGGIFLIINIFFLFLLSQLKLIEEEFYYKINFIFLIFSFFIVGFCDDKIKLNPLMRFVLIFLLIILFLINSEFLILNINFTFKNSFLIENKIAQIFFTSFCIVAFINALNFFDGINLQVSIYSILVLTFFSFIKFSFFLLIIILSLLFFLILNYKNKSFLGDSGVYILGVIISLTSINLHNSNLLYADEVIFLMFLPGLDMIRLFFERIINKKNPFLGDNHHIHHLLKKKFFGKTILITIFISFFPFLIYKLFVVFKVQIFIIFVLLYFMMVNLLKKNEY